MGKYIRYERHSIVVSIASATVQKQQQQSLTEGDEELLDAGAALGRGLEEHRAEVLRQLLALHLGHLLLMGNNNNSFIMIIYIYGDTIYRYMLITAAAITHPFVCEVGLVPHDGDLSTQRQTHIILSIQYRLRNQDQVGR